jgi:Fe-S-cluster containining protein
MSAIDPQTGCRGICIETGMESFYCRQCGRCCRTLDYHSGITAEDVASWQESGRADILEWVGVTRSNCLVPVYRIWVTPGTNQLAEVCPFLKRQSSENRWLCRIHDVKPKICREYPVSRKHALKTGCRGFETR